MSAVATCPCLSPSELVRRLRDSDPKEARVTLIWFVVWLIANNIGDEEPLTFDPVNWWAGSLILVAAVDLARQHAPEFSRPRDSA